MLGILLMELWLNKACQLPQGTRNAAPDETHTHLQTWYEAEWNDLPGRYGDAIETCIFLGTASAFVVEKATKKLDSIAGDVRIMYEAIKK